MDLLGYKISPKYPDILENKKTIINTLNPHSYRVAKKDAEFQAALKQSCYLMPDGIGIVRAAKLLKGKKIKRIAGYDVFLHLMKKLDATGGSCFFLGSSDMSLIKIKKKIKVDFPNVVVHSYSPPFKNKFTKEENEMMCRQVNAVEPDVLFVGMTAPKQEKWVLKNKDNLKTRVICSVGAVFDFYAGTVKRPSKFWIDLGLEWLPRFVKEPIRLAERNLVSTPMFVLDVILSKFRRTDRIES